MQIFVFFTSVSLGDALASAAEAQTTVVSWTFEIALPATAGPFLAEGGLQANTMGTSASGFHAGTSSYSIPAGNGSSHSFSSTKWAVGDYYQFTLSTLGLADMSVGFDQTSSSTGPRDLPAGALIFHRRKRFTATCRRRRLRSVHKRSAS